MAAEPLRRQCPSCGGSGTTPRVTPLQYVIAEESGREICCRCGGSGKVIMRPEEVADEGQGYC